jgi:hypothetical protein
MDWNADRRFICHPLESMTRLQDKSCLSTGLPTTTLSTSLAPNLTSNETKEQDHKQPLAEADPLRPFDLLFCQGQGWPGRIIQASQKLVLGTGTWSHIGMLIPKRMVKEVEPDAVLDDEWYIWESTVSFVDGIPSISGFKSGVQLRPLSRMAEHYEYQIALARVTATHLPLLPTDQTKAVKIWSTLYKEVKHIAYDFRPTSLCGALLSCCRPCRSAQSSTGSAVDSSPLATRMFCSEFVAYVLQRLAPTLFSPRLRAEHVMPMDLLGYDRDWWIPRAVCHDALRDTTTTTTTASTTSGAVVILPPIGKEGWNRLQSQIQKAAKAAVVLPSKVTTPETAPEDIGRSH